MNYNEISNATLAIWHHILKHSQIRYAINVHIPMIRLILSSKLHYWILISISQTGVGCLLTVKCVMSKTRRLNGSLHHTHNISMKTNRVSSLFYIHPQLARHNKELQAMLKPGGTYGEGDEALEFYAKHTAQIEVSNGHL